MVRGRPKQAARPSSESSTERGTVVFFHPDLGIGGAERLVVDAAVGLQELGHRVVIFTTHRDPKHCFDEARDGELSGQDPSIPATDLAGAGTLDVRVRGNALPPMLGGRFKILLSILRHYHLLASIFVTGELRGLRPGAFFVDQLSAGIPLLRTMFPAVRVLFYCHPPDLLLVQRRGVWFRRLWRWPFDALEGWTTHGADRVVVNSEYTGSVVRGVWPALGGSVGLGVVYPCVDTGAANKAPMRGFPRLWGGKKVVLSINRFERKKGVDLAVRAFAELERGKREGAKLIIAGEHSRSRRRRR